MWRELEKTIRLGKPETTRLVRELKPGDSVHYGDNVAGVTVYVVDENTANVFALQKALMIGVGEGVNRRTMGYQDPIMPADAEREVEKQSIHITGGSVGRKAITIEWYPSSSSTQ